MGGCIRQVDVSVMFTVLSASTLFTALTEMVVCALLNVRLL